MATLEARIDEALAEIGADVGALIAGGGGGGTRISDLTAVVTPVDTDLLALVNGAATKKLTLNQLEAYIGSRTSLYNASVAAQGPGFATDTYLTGSDIAIPSGRLQAKSMYRIKIRASKTNAGTATPILTVRVGTAGAIGDTSRGTLTFQAQTGAVDEAVMELFSTFRTVGSGTSAVLYTYGMIDHRLAVTGFANINTGMADATSGGFDSTVADLKIGVSANGGTSAAWTVQSVQAELYNLA